MTVKEIMKLEPGNRILHKHLGICEVIELITPTTGEGLFGIIILPDNMEGRLLLQKWTGMPPQTPMLETTYRLIKAI